ncbi:hypothetical protein LOK49_LG12G00390 [Camellia lanceoleosa]|uniref:Uncharacterized protein n=1 Tax=Camellia lanceoleosa TaxID=1840588 RepID=A0ACC0FV19_9ERIC|nr:hypothetical protein LOK49_LG12G00390 [Camellia lanceoleosa]
MAVRVRNYWNPLFPSSIFLPCSLLFFFTLYYFPLHATALSFNFPKIDQTLQNIKVIANPPAYINDDGIQVTPNDLGTDRSQRAGRATYKDPLHLWDRGSGNLTDFTTYFSFVIDSRRSHNYGDGLTFFLVPNGSTPDITSGGAMGLPINPQTNKWTTPFVAVEFDTCPHNDRYPKETHVGIDINSLTSNATQVWYNNITYGIENEAWISYDSSSQNLSVIFTGSINNQRIKSSLSYLVDLREYLSEWVTIGFSAATGLYFEKHTIKSWQFNSTLQIDVSTEPDPSPALAPNTVIPGFGKKMGAKSKKALVVRLIVGSLVLVGGLALVGFVMWKKSRAKEEDKFAIEISMNNEFEAVFSFVSPLSFNFDNFNPNNHEINYEGDAYPAAGAIQLTLNEHDKDMSGKTGQATYTESLHLWDNASGNLSDFTTHFSFVISTANISSPITGGDGLAFFLVPNGSHIPPNTEGGSFGLGHSLESNNQTTNSTSPPFVAVEFATFVNQWDSDTGAHIGIDINSVSSVATLPASIHAGKKVDSWISYDAKLNNLSVLFKGYKAELDGIYYIINLRKYLPEWVTFGFSATTGASTEIHSICSWYFNSSLQTIGLLMENKSKEGKGEWWKSSCLQRSLGR